MLRETITTSEIRSVVRAFGYLADGRRTVVTYSYTIYFVLYLINLSFGLSHEWNNFNVRMEIIRSLFLMCNMQVYWLSIPDIYILLGIFERHKQRLLNMKHFNKLSRKFYTEINGMEDHSNYFVWTFILVNVCYTCLPLLNAVYTKLTLTSSADGNFEDLPQVSYLYYPVGGPVTFTHYCCGALFLSAGVLAATVIGFCFLYACYLALRCVAMAFDQLTTLITEWDSSSSSSSSKNTHHTSKISSQKDCLREIVEFHQEICSEARLLNKGMETATINLLQECVVQLCLGLFSIIEGGEKIKYGGFTCFVLLMLVGFSFCGQILEDRIARVKWSIWECDWVDKPYFIRKALLTMMIGASARLELRPYGLQQLNMSTFASVLKSVYSLFNVVNQSR